MAVGDTHVFPCFLKPVILSKATLKMKVRRNRVSNSQPPGHESDRLTTEPPRRTRLGFNTSPNDKILERLKNQSICRRQNKCGAKIEICVWEVRKHDGERRKKLVTSIFYSSHIFKSFSNIFFFFFPSTLGSLKVGLYGKVLNT